uniref:Uncharacterized protein n=1 Tax=Labrus bergylta TaxID=56723 RepID=A0A3Q3E4R5_9LABR
MSPMAPPPPPPRPSYPDIMIHLPSGFSCDHLVELFKEPKSRLSALQMYLFIFLAALKKAERSEERRWAPCSLVGRRVLSLGAVFSRWAPCSLVGRRVLSLGAVFSRWAPCSLAGRRVLSLGAVFSRWAPCSLVGRRLLL